MKFRKFSLFLTLFFIQNLVGQVRTKSFVSKKDVFLGDIFEYNIVVEHNPNTVVEKFEIYDVLKDTSGVENFMLFAKKVKKRQNFFNKKVRQEFGFQLIPLKIGKLTIEELKINCLNRVSNESFILNIPKIEIEVKPYPKLKGKKFDGEIVDIKSQIWVRDYLFLIFLLLAVLGFLIYIIYQYKIKPQQNNIQLIQQQIDIKEVALKKLDDLWNKNYISNGLIKEFYLELTEIVRCYIGKRHNINALELTTEELFSALKKKVEKKYNLELKSFLDNADLAKFAKYIPEKEQILKDFELAKKFII
ncbi:MAG: BatD family protein [Endomicrobiia bacterium]